MVCHRKAIKIERGTAYTRLLYISNSFISDLNSRNLHPWTLKKHSTKGNLLES